MENNVEFENMVILMTVEADDGEKSVHQVIIPKGKHDVIKQLLVHDDGVVKLVEDKLELTIGKEKQDERG